MQLASSFFVHNHSASSLNSRQRSRLLSVRVSSSIDCDVGICGAGPAGLAAAAALRKADPSLRVRVFERSDMKARGSAVMVGANGLMALNAIDSSITDKLMTHAITLEGSDRYCMQTGQLLEHVLMRNDECDAEYGFHSVLFGWSDITSSLRAMLPDDAVVTNTPVTRYNTLPDGSLQLLGPGSSNNGSSSSSSGEVIATCRAVVGADGWLSSIRQQLLGDGPPTFRGMVVFRARVKQPSWMTNRVSKRWVPPSGDSQHDITAAVTPVPGGDVVWQVHCPASIMKLRGLDFDPVHGEVGSTLHADNTNTDTGGGGCCGCGACSTSSANTKQRCLKVVDGLASQLMDLVKTTPGHAISEHGLYQRTPEQIPDDAWGAGMVTLVGDAAHSAYVDGTGIGLCFGDAAVLGWHIQQNGLTEQALRDFERQRIPRVKAVFGMTAQQRAAAAAGTPREQLARERADLLYGQATFKQLAGVVA